MIKKISINRVDKLYKRGTIDKENIQLFQYGINALLELTISIIASIIVAVLLDEVITTGIFIGVFVMIRSYIGGIHMRHFSSCLIASLVLQIFTSKVWKYINISIVSCLLMVLVLSLIIFLCSCLWVNINERYLNQKLKKNLIFIICISLIFTLLKKEKYIIIIMISLLEILILLYLEKIKNIIGKR